MLFMKQPPVIHEILIVTLWFFIDHKQKDWSKWLITAEFAVNNKTHSVTKVSSFIENYGIKLRMGMDIRRKSKVEKMMEFAERMKKVQEKARAALKRA